MSVILPCVVVSFTINCVGWVTARALKSANFSKMKCFSQIVKIFDFINLSSKLSDFLEQDLIRFMNLSEINFNFVISLNLSIVVVLSALILNDNSVVPPAPCQLFASV